MFAKYLDKEQKNFIGLKLRMDYIKLSVSVGQKGTFEALILEDRAVGSEKRNWQLAGNSQSSDNKDLSSQMSSN